MAATITQISSAVPGASVEKLVNITLDTSYPNPAGYVFSAASLGVTVLRKVVLNAFTTIAGAKYEIAMIPTYNADGQTIASIAVHLIVGTTGLEVANAVDVSGVSFQLIVGGN